MKKQYTKLFYLILSVTVLFACKVNAITPLEANGQLKVDVATGKLVNKNNYPIQLRGMSSHGLQWFPDMMNPTSIKALQEDWGADVVRLSTYIQEGGYEEDPAYFTALVDSLVEVVTAQGMYVLIDFHQLDPGDPNANIGNAKTFFTHMASTHKEKKNIFYEICNEPNGDDVTWSRIKKYADVIIPLIREHDSNNIIIVGTPTWCQDIDAVIGNRIDDDNVMYTVHFYATDHREYVRDKVEIAVNAKIPVFVTECGTQEASGDGINDFASSRQWFDFLDENKISWVNWNFSFDERTGAVFESEPSNYEDYAFYTNDNNLKEAGLWIKKRMQTTDDWGLPVDSTIPYTVTVHSGSGSDTFYIGDTVTIVADSAPNGLVFDEWIGDLALVTATFDSVTTFIMPAKNLTFSAFYKEAGATIDTAALSENFATIGTWAPNTDNNGSSATIDSSFGADSSLTFTINKSSESIVWAQARGKVEGKYDAVNVIKISYSSTGPVEIVLDNPYLDSEGASHIYGLPASEDTTLYIEVDSFYQPAWTPTSLYGDPDMSSIESISIAAVNEGLTTIVLKELRLNRFQRAVPISVTAKKSQTGSLWIANNQLQFEGFQNSNFNLALYNLRGQELFRSSLLLKNGIGAVALPTNLGRGHFVVRLQGENFETTKLLMK